MTWLHHSTRFPRPTYLLRPSDPGYVPRLVRERVVQATKAHTRRAVTQQTVHVSPERRKFTPALAHQGRVIPPDTPPDVIQIIATRSVHVPPRVPGLFRPGRPADITRLVVPVVINPVQRHTRRARADQTLDVFDEQSRVMPSRAGCNSPATPVLVLRKVRVIAPRHHVAPGPVKRVLRPVMPGEPVAGALAARSCSPGVIAQEIVDSRLIRTPAVTPQFSLPPERSVLTRRELPDDYSPAVSLTWKNALCPRAWHGSMIPGEHTSMPVRGIGGEPHAR